MNGRELFAIMNKKEMPPRIPFVPTIYEHAASLIGKTPSQVAKDVDLLVQAQLAAYSVYKHDLIAVGLDIYNIELEALGAAVEYYGDASLPAIEEVLVENPEHLDRLSIPNPETDGRMPLLLDAVDQVTKAVGDEVPVNGAITGPFTLAALLRGFEQFIMDLVFDPPLANRLLEFAKQVGLAYAQGYQRRGVGLSVNESWITPPLLSPAMYREHVLPLHTQMIGELKEMGFSSVALISGGDTTAIAEDLLHTGTSLLMADHNTDQAHYQELCATHDVVLRASIASKLVETGSREELAQAVESLVSTCGSYYKLVFGCGIVSFETDPQQVVYLRHCLEDCSEKRCG